MAPITAHHLKACRIGWFQEGNSERRRSGVEETELKEVSGENAEQDTGDPMKVQPAGDSLRVRVTQILKRATQFCKCP